MTAPKLEEKRTFSCVLPIAPVAKARARVTRFGTFTPQKTKDFEAAVFWHLRDLKAPLFDGPVWVRATFVLERPKSPKARTRVFPMVRGSNDVDNLFKAVADAAIGGLWVDDCQIVKVEAEKLYGSPARIELAVGEL